MRDSRFLKTLFLIVAGATVLYFVGVWSGMLAPAGRRSNLLVMEMVAAIICVSLIAVVIYRYLRRG